MGTRWRIAVGLFVATAVLCTQACRQEQRTDQPGLVGLYFSEPNLTAIKARMVLTSFEQNWDASAYQTTGSSGVWRGRIIGPTDGDVRFHLNTNKIVELRIDEDRLGRADAETPESTLVVTMAEGEVSRIHVTFLNDGRKDGKDFGAFSIKWSWDGAEPETIPTEFFFHTAEDAEEYRFLDEPDAASIDQSRLVRIDAEHRVVYYEKERFAGWPANNGIWSWGDEIVVGFSRAWYDYNPYHHSIDSSRPGGAVLARSTDGGETWRLEEPVGFEGEKANGLREFSFADPDIAIRNDRDHFVVSRDRGRSWQGPFEFAGLDMGKLSARTDYLINSPDDAFFFLSADDIDSVQAILQDRAFMAHTTDGGRSFEFVAWMSDDETARSVMSSTVRVSPTHLVTTLRRRFDPPGDFRVLPENWIDAYESRDNGRTWQFLSRVADTDTGLRNGNPPALVRTDDGLLAVSYGYRGVPYGIRARVSVDDGATWGREIVLRDDASTWDIGYCRAVVRNDGKIVTVYYYATEDRPEQHIEATVWDPASVSILAN